MSVPRRVTVIGNGGSGKTTLSLRLGKAHDLPVFHMDRLIWRPGWQPTPEAEVRQSLHEIMVRDRWLIDGLGPLWSIEARIPHADLILFLDFPLEHCRRWAMERQTTMSTAVRDDVTEGCFLEGLDQRMYDLLGRVDAEYLPAIRQMLAPPEVACKSRHITNPEELDALSLA